MVRLTERPFSWTYSSQVSSAVWSRPSLPNKRRTRPPAFVPWKVTETSSRFTSSAQEICSEITWPVFNRTKP